MKGRPKDPKRSKRRTGHRRKPDEAPALKAVPQESPNAAVPELVAEPPEHLSEEGQEIWRRLVEVLAEGGVPLRAGDMFVIESIVTQYLRMQQLGQVVDDYGVIQKKPSGEAVASPFVRAERDAAGMLLRLMEQYGGTVAARMRLGLMQLQGKAMHEALSEDLES